MTLLSNAALSALATACRFASTILENAWLIAIVALIISPIGPHMLLSETGPAYRGGGGNCSYFGSRGVVQLYAGRCSFVQIIDSRKGSRR